MSELYHVAALQMVSGADVTANLDAADQLIARAVDRGARLVVLPENFAYFGHDEADKLQVAEPPGDGRMQRFLSEAAARHGVWVVGGTIPLVSDEPDRVRAACLVMDDTGTCRGRYDKLHMFDVEVRDGETYAESHTLQPGDGLTVIDTPVGRLGIGICYDLRFPELFRALVAEGAEVLAVPSAFTAMTGAAHWELLVRARAVENLCYVIAANQGGSHPTGRRTFGESMIVDPWGRILARRGTGPGAVTAALDRREQDELKERFPVLAHRRAMPPVQTRIDESPSTPVRRAAGESANEQ